jgi:ABC-type transporter Mla subunit MlaD
VTETGRSDPFADVISLISGPITAVIRSFDQLRKGADELMRGFENFNTTMTNLNETAQRINGLLNDFEEPVRAMLPQIRRTIDAAENMSTRLSGPVDDVIPGLNQLAETLNSPVLQTMPADLGEFMNVINDLSRRLGPLGQFAEQAGKMFGLRPPPASSPPAKKPAPAKKPPTDE